ncbi:MULTISPECIES: hypothetical protein [Bacillus]|uniref:hypothetical protein n=1 Tax=Bacillus TaxID=1386 RepID=UPI0011A25B00|nr:hypothetical protein [Bacillus altitudinis]
MNGREQAEEKIIDFLKSDERVAIVTGTHMFEKHKLVVRVLDENLQNAKILFRTSNMRMAAHFLNNDNPMKTGRPYNGENCTFFVDTVNKKTWDKHGNINIAIIYPLKPVSDNKIRKEIIENLFDFHGIQKLFFVSSQDTLDLTWAASINTKIVYDSLEDDPEYHQRVIDDIASKGFKRL